MINVPKNGCGIILEIIFFGGGINFFAMVSIENGKVEGGWGECAAPPPQMHSQNMLLDSPAVLFGTEHNLRKYKAFIRRLLTRTYLRARSEGFVDEKLLTGCC